MSGSINEWVFDQYGTYPLPCDDCAAIPSPGGQNVKRGEDWINSTFVATTTRDSDLPSGHSPGDGMRCAR